MVTFQKWNQFYEVCFYFKNFFIERDKIIKKRNGKFFTKMNVQRIDRMFAAHPQNLLCIGVYIPPPFHQATYLQKEEHFPSPPVPRIVPGCTSVQLLLFYFWPVFKFVLPTFYHCGHQMHNCLTC